MKLKDIFAELSAAGLDAGTLALFGIVLPLLVAAGVYGFKYWKAWRAQKKSAEPLTLRPLGQTGAPSELDSGHLRKAWLRFLERLPLNYRRSILNFDHFVVFGLAGSGKSRLMEAHTDFRYQMKQVARDAPVDPELPVVLGSGAIIIEVPARYLEDDSAAARETLEHLWRPLYGDKSPTVVFTLDVSWLMASTVDVLSDVSRALRVRVNQLSSLRRRPIEVRIGVTHLDVIEGVSETARFWSRAEISTRIPLAAEGSTRASLLAWELELQAQLPRALASLTSDEYHKVVAFMRRTRTFLTPLEVFLDALFAPDVMSESPLRGGIFLHAGASDEANPLEHGLEEGPGPDPLKRHAIAAAALLGVCAAYMTVAFAVQRRVWEPAADAIVSYEISPALVGSDHEKRQRQVLTEFTVRHEDVLHRFPDFFRRIRARAQDNLSSKLRDGLLIPRLREVAQHGIVGQDKMTLRWRRTIYFLGLLHSYQADKLEIRRQPKLDIWEEMTGIPKSIVIDYIDNTLVPVRDPLHFKLGYSENDVRDSAAYWRKLPLGLNKAMADGVIRPEELDEMKRQASLMAESLSRFDHDDLTIQTLKDIDSAADTGGERDGVPAPKLASAYAPMFASFLDTVQAADLQRQVGELKRLVSLIMSASIEEDKTLMLSDLLDRLTVLQNPGAAVDRETSIQLRLAGESFAIELAKWKELLKNSRAALLIDRFVAATAESQSIFFSSSLDAELRTVVWNALGDDTSIFRGSATLAGRYTKAAFEQRVKHEVVRLAELLAKIRLPAEHAERLNQLVEAEVSRYALLYREEAMHFLRSYELRAQSPEALRVALGQISGEKSTFDDFVHALDENTALGDDDVPADKPKIAASPQNPKKEAEAPAGNRDLVDQLLSPLHTALADFRSFHAAVGGQGGSELSKYKEIVEQLLTDLTAVAEVPAKGRESEASLLEKELSPVGRVTLHSLQSEKGSYDEIVQNWIASAGLTAEQRAPFLAPFQQLDSMGDSDIESVVMHAWTREMWPALQAITAKFPFDRDAGETATPDDVAELFHPADGRFFPWFRGYVQPLSEPADGKKQRALPAVRERIHLPAELYPAANAASILAARLWDEKGSMRPLEFRVTPVPFERGTSARYAPTMIHLQVGQTSVFNFNQAPTPSAVSVDWTTDDSAQIGIQVTEIESGENTFPAPLSAPGPFWRLFRLLRVAKATRVRTPAEGELYEWDLRLRDLNPERVRARLLVVGDAWKGFSFPRMTGAMRAAR